MPPAAQQPNQSDGSSGVLWMIAMLFAALAVLWYVFKKYLVVYFLQFKLLEISLIDHFTNHLDPLRDIILQANPQAMTFENIVTIGNAVGDYLRYPCILLIIILAFVVFFSNSVRTYKRIYNMHDLATVEQVNYPQISPVTKLSLIKTDLDKGPWAMAMTPMHYCKRYGLLEERKKQNQEGMTRKERNKIEVALRRGRATQLFALQLGPLWISPDKLPQHVRALFTVFAARMNNDTEAAANLLKQLNISSTSKLNFNGVDALLKKHIDSKMVQTVMHSHAYIMTVMASMLAGARSDGVQATADFLWLKPMDRRLWYTLNVVGRQTPFVEVAGIYAHWVAEKDIGRKLIIPMVEEATNALDLALKDIVYRPDEELKPDGGSEVK